MAEPDEVTRALESVHLAYVEAVNAAVQAGRDDVADALTHVYVDETLLLMLDLER